MELRKELGGLGIKNIELMNIALICKLVWRFLENDDVMWVQLLSAKYLHDASFWLSEKPEKCSATWSSMLEVRNILENKIFWHVNNGNKIHIWNDPWIQLSVDHLTDRHATLPININKVSDLINDSKFQRLEHSPAEWSILSRDCAMHYVDIFKQWNGFSRYFNLVLCSIMKIHYKVLLQYADE